MNKYEEFDNSMVALKRIEKELSEMSGRNDISLAKIMELREEAKKHYEVCNNLLTKFTSNKTSE